jgi:uncharacterized protein (TIGR04255 family)
MTNLSMGSWRNPPLAYVVAEVKFSPLYSLERHVPDFQAEIREDFPRSREATVLRFELQGNALNPQQEKAWRFFNESQRLGIDLSTRTLSLHATEYRDFDTFLRPLATMLAAAEKAIPNLFIEQLGLRYIDYILPADGESGFDYVVDSVRGFRPPGASPPKEAYWVAHFPFERGGVNLRIIPRLPAGAAYPPNFGPIEISPAETQLEAMRRAQKQESVGCIDTDRIIPIEKKLDAKLLLDEFSAMHADVSATFKAAISEKAKHIWI